MTQFEVLRLCESTLKMLEGNGIDARDIRYIDMYRDYVRLSGEGHKMTYIVAYLSEQYNCGVATIYRAVSRMQREITY